MRKKSLITIAAVAVLTLIGILVRQDPPNSGLLTKIQPFGKAGASAWVICGEYVWGSGTARARSISAW